MVAKKRKDPYELSAEKWSKENTRSTQIRLPEVLIKALDLISAKTGQSRNALIFQAVAKWAMIENPWAFDRQFKVDLRPKITPVQED